MYLHAWMHVLHVRVNVVRVLGSNTGRGSRALYFTFPKKWFPFYYVVLIRSLAFLRNGVSSYVILIRSLAFLHKGASYYVVLIRSLAFQPTNTDVFATLFIHVYTFLYVLLHKNQEYALRAHVFHTFPYVPRKFLHVPTGFREIRVLFSYVLSNPDQVPSNSTPCAPMFL